MLPKKVLTCEMSLVDANMYYVLPLLLLLHTTTKDELRIQALRVNGHRKGYHEAVS